MERRAAGHYSRPPVKPHYGPWRVTNAASPLVVSIITSLLLFVCAQAPVQDQYVTTKGWRRWSGWIGPAGPHQLVPPPPILTLALSTETSAELAFRLLDAAGKFFGVAWKKSKKKWVAKMLKVEKRLRVPIAPLVRILGCVCCYQLLGVDGSKMFPARNVWRICTNLDNLFINN